MDFLAYCESKGILVFLFPAYVGAGAATRAGCRRWWRTAPAKMQSYGAWIATRYKNQKNLVWMMGGDMGTPPDAFNAAQTAVESCAAYRPQERAGAAVHAVQRGVGLRSRSRRTRQRFGASMTLNGAYSWSGDVNSQGRRAYAHSPVNAGVPARRAVRRRGAGRKRRQSECDAAGATFPVVGLAVNHRRLHLGQRLCLAVPHVGVVPMAGLAARHQGLHLGHRPCMAVSCGMARSPGHAGFAGHGTAQRFHQIHRVVQTRSVGLGWHAEPDYRGRLIRDSSTTSLLPRRRTEHSWWPMFRLRTWDRSRWTWRR